MIRSVIPAALCFLLLTACETAPKPVGQNAVIAPAADDEPAMAPRRREPCGEGPVMLPGDSPRQTGVVTSDGKPIE